LYAGPKSARNILTNLSPSPGRLTTLVGTTVVHVLVPGMTTNETKYVKVLREKSQLRMSVHLGIFFMHDGALVTTESLLRISWDEKI